MKISALTTLAATTAAAGQGTCWTVMDSTVQVCDMYFRAQNPFNLYFGLTCTHMHIVSQISPGCGFARSTNYPENKTSMWCQ